MGRKAVVECTCARCKKTWYEPVAQKSEDKHFLLPTTTLNLKLSGGLSVDSVEVSFDLMCDVCTKAVRNYVASILLEPKKDSGAKEEERDGPSPLSGGPGAPPGSPRAG